MVWKETAWTAMSGEKSTAKMRPKLEPEPDSAFFAGAAAALAGAAFFAPPKDGKEMDGALKDGALKDGALKDGPFAASFFVFFSVTLTLVFSCWAANNSAAADLESPFNRGGGRERARHDAESDDGGSRLVTRVRANDGGGTARALARDGRGGNGNLHLLDLSDHVSSRSTACVACFTAGLYDSASSRRIGCVEFVERRVRRVGELSYDARVDSRASVDGRCPSFSRAKERPHRPSGREGRETSLYCLHIPLSTTDLYPKQENAKSTNREPRIGERLQIFVSEKSSSETSP
jgi:hypothetical protein